MFVLTAGFLPILFFAGCPPIPEEEGPARDRAPSAPTVSISPEAPATGDDLVATVTEEAVDPEGAAVVYRYAWWADGALRTTLTTKTVPAGETRSGEVWKVEVFAADRSQEGEAGTTSVTIQSTPPAVTTVTVTPLEPLPGDALLCAATGEDPDGDTVTFSMRWLADGVAWGGAATTTTWPGDTVSAGHTRRGEIWTCEATPADDEAAGAPGSAAVTVLRWEGARELSTCGATGATGPSSKDCTKVLAGTPLEAELVVTSGIQAWTVPIGGTFHIEAAGAQGASAGAAFAGGLGAYASGDFVLAEGDVLLIAVGQEGLGAGSEMQGGGGGGTWVVNAAGEALLVAGGGGGTRADATQSGCGGRGGEYGGKGSGEAAESTCVARKEGPGEGGQASAESWGSGGGGFLSSGGDDTVYGFGGASWALGLAGGASNPDYDCQFDAQGGFGGGGAGNGCYGGGGGGGYSGGEGGWIAGGGGSTNAGATPVTVAGDNVGDGWVKIDLVE
ncbi:hypothetical protein LBMAG42_53410 [Deltaproteobacteria bacterium]|nr:hypothetical protein LBMAG42_53410 [Deltaproteobacteria bacterium]